MGPFTQRLDNSSSPQAPVGELVNLSNVAGREFVKQLHETYHINTELLSSQTWRDHTYFSLPGSNPRFTDIRSERFGMELGAFVHESARTLRHYGYDTSPTDGVELKEYLQGSNASTHVMRLTQDVAALNAFVNSDRLRADLRPRYEAALVLRASQLAEICHFPAVDAAAQQSQLATARETLAQSNVHQL